MLLERGPVFVPISVPRHWGWEGISHAIRHSGLRRNSRCNARSRKEEDILFLADLA